MVSILEWLATTIMEGPNGPRAPKRFYDEVDREREKLLATLSDEQKKLLESYENAFFALDGETEVLCFVHGFRTAMSIFRECSPFEDKDGGLR